MPITTVNYQKTFNLGNYTSERIGVEISLNDNQDAKEAIAEAKKLVEEFHAETNKGLYCQDMLTGMVSIGEPMAQIQPAAQRKHEPTKPLTLVEQIQSCTEIKVLESYRLIAKSKPDLQAAYLDKLKELSK